MICPECGDEFVEGVARCGSCEVDLVEPDVAGGGGGDELNSDDVAHALSGQPLAAVTEGPLLRLKEIRRVLAGEGIPAAIAGCEDDGACGPAKMRLLIAVSDFERAQELMHENWRTTLVEEGLGADTGGAVDLDAAEVTCPACGHVGALVAGACVECELVLGLPGA